MGLFVTNEVEEDRVVKVDLSTTEKMMTSDKWQERFIAEYNQLVIRMRDLDTYISNVEDEEHKKLLIEQYNAMSLYEQALYDRAKLLNIDLPTWKELGYE